MKGFMGVFIALFAGTAALQPAFAARMYENANKATLEATPDFAGFEIDPTPCGGTGEQPCGAAGGAIWNSLDLRTASIVGPSGAGVTFTGSVTSAGDALGGAIYNEGRLGTDAHIAIKGKFWNSIVTATASDGNAKGGAIYNNEGGIGVIVGTDTLGFGDFYQNRAISTGGGNAYGGAIYNTGTITAISASFKDNFAEADSTGRAFGGAIYTTKSLKFLADGGDLVFSGNYATDSARGKIFNAIYVDGPEVTLTFETKNGRMITMDDQIESGEIGGETVKYNIDIISDGAAGQRKGEIRFNNEIYGAEYVSVTNTTLALGQNGVTRGRFLESYGDTTGGMANLNLDNGELLIDYNSIGAPISLASLNMKNGSVIRWDPAAAATLINAETFWFGGENTIHGNMTTLAGSDITFHIPAGVTKGATLLTITGAANVAGSTINVDIDGASTLKKGNTIVLIDAGSPIVGDGLFTMGEIRKGALSFEAELTISGNLLEMLLMDGTLEPKTKSYSEGNLGVLAFLNQGGNMVANAGIVSAVRSVKLGRNSPYNAAWFSAASGGLSRYETGSHVDVLGLSMMTGLAFRPNRRTTVGAFVEYGIGKYDSFNEVSGGKVESEGDVNYAGLGLVAHRRFGRGMYGEGSLRGGTVKNVYKTDDADLDANSFDSSTLYFGGHAGVGYVARLRRLFSELDSSIKYIATMQMGHKATTSISNETIKFDDIFSQRLRAGTRLTLGTSVHRPYVNPSSGIVLNKMALGDAIVRPYIGFAAEYDFGTNATATLDNFAIDAPSMAGTTGMGEAGLAIENENMTLSLGGEGYIGVRRGFGGMLQFRYRFEL